MQRPQHPSGRPKRERQYRELSIRRYPPDEPLTPGLRRGRNVSAIGFRVQVPDDFDADLARESKAAGYLQYGN